MSWGPQPSPLELEMLMRQEEAARARLAEARERQKIDEGDAPHEHAELIRKLEAEWKHALERLERHRKA